MQKNGTTVTAFVSSLAIRLTRVIESLTFEARRRTPGWYHVSEIQDMCVRQEQLMERHKVDAETNTPLVKRLMFDLGKAYHDVIRRYVRLDGKLIGLWECRGCGKLRKGFGPRPKVPCACGSKRVQYVEPELKEEALRMIGHADMAEEEYRLLVFTDVKSAGKSKFEKIKKPFAEDVWQLSQYIDMGQRHPEQVGGRKVAGFGRLFYVATSEEGLVFGSPFKEFIVRKSQKAVDEAKTKLLELRKKTLAERVCKREQERRACDCPVRWHCFHGKG